ncbi:MAG: hypothetical protein Q7R95_06055 [bacterium]|nr:hypothetical protein [bacterium]
MAAGDYKHGFEIIQDWGKHGLMPRIGGRDYEIPVSRDYKLVIPCERADCPINQLLYCSMASAIKISSAGRCSTGDDLISEKIKLEKERKEKELKDSNGKWKYTVDGD